MTEEDVKKVFEDVGAPLPKEIIPKDIKGDNIVFWCCMLNFFFNSEIL
jgi:hypothetical protein